jgi:hypothetical protein
MLFNLLTAGIALALFGGLMAFQEIGRRFGRARCKREGDKLAGLSAVDTAVLALLGLLTAFAFDGAAARFDHRRDLVTAELNAIDSGYQQLALLPDGPRAKLQEQMRRYLRARIDTYRALPHDISAARASLALSQRLQDEIWSQLVPAARAAGDAAVIVVLPAVTEMFDAAITRLFAMQMHPPIVMFVMLGVVAVLSALLAGFDMGTLSARPAVHMLIYASTIALTIYVILELEFPQIGWVRVDGAERNLMHLLERLK